MNGRIENDKMYENRINKMIRLFPKPMIRGYIAYMRACDKSECTIYNYLSILKRFFKTLHHPCFFATMDELTAEKVVEFLQNSKTKETADGKIVETSGSHRQVVWCCMNDFLDYLVDAGYKEENYIRKLKIKKPKNNDAMRIEKERIHFTKDDLHHLVECVENADNTFHDRDLAIILLFLNTGMRKTALASINTDDIDFKEGTVKVIDKGDKTHIYQLNRKTMSALKKWYKVSVNGGFITEPDGAFFTNKYGERLGVTSVDDTVKKYTLEAFGTAMYPHKLRAAFCSVLYDETGDIEFVRRAVGHASVKTTQRYITTDNKESKRASDIMESIM